MPWVVGIDEAGYGPNLGPLVQSAVAVRLPDGDPAGWDTLAAVIRRAGGRWGRDSRLVIDDSKRVYHGIHALGRLEHGVLSWFGFAGLTLGDLLTRVGLPNALPDSHLEPWFVPTAPLERHGKASPQPNFAAHGVALGPVAVNVVHPPRFNKLVDAAGSKAVVLAVGLVELLKHVLAHTPGDDELRILCDKQGGRNFYAPLLQEAFPDGFVIAEVERMDESRYRVEQLPRRVVIQFKPRADAGSVAVATASMTCKYVREVCMVQFNEYWAKRVPGLKETAGYPVDALRFIADIRPAMAAEGMREELVWRVK